MAHWLRVFIALPEDTTLMPLTSAITTSGTPTLGDAIPDSGPCRCLHACANTHRHINKIVNLFFLKLRE